MAETAGRKYRGRFLERVFETRCFSHWKFNVRVRFNDSIILEQKFKRETARSLLYKLTVPFSHAKSLIGRLRLAWGWRRYDHFFPL